MEYFAAGSVTSVNLAAGKISGFSMFLYSFILLLFFRHEKKSFFPQTGDKFFHIQLFIQPQKKQSTCMQASFI